MGPEVEPSQPVLRFPHRAARALRGRASPAVRDVHVGSPRVRAAGPGSTVRPGGLWLRVSPDARGTVNLVCGRLGCCRSAPVASVHPVMRGC